MKGRIGLYAAWCSQQQLNKPESAAKPITTVLAFTTRDPERELLITCVRNADVRLMLLIPLIEASVLLQSP